MAAKTTKTATKSENKQAVFRFLQRTGSATKQELFGGLDLSLPTIRQSLDYLEAEGLVRKAEVIKNTGGRNAVSYQVNGDGRYAAGLYFSKNHLTAVCVDLDGEVVSRKRIRIEMDLHEDACLRKLGELTEEVIREAGIDKEKLVGVGIAVPSLVSENGEYIIFGMTNDFSGITRTVLSRYLSYPTRMFHDSDAAGFAEIWKEQDSRKAFFINLNSSIGGAFIQDSRIYAGENSRAAEIGHMILYPGGKTCYCGKKGCFDTACNAGVLEALTDGSLQEFFDRLAQRDGEAEKLWEEYLDNLALAVHNIRMLFDCSIILGGYIGSYMEPYLHRLRKRADDLSIFGDHAEEYLFLSKYQKESTAAGAAIRVLDEMIQKI